MNKPNPKIAPQPAASLDPNDRWELLRNAVEFEDEEAMVKEHLGSQSKLIDDILRAIKEAPGQEKHLTLQGSRAEVQLFWDDEQAPVLRLITEHMPSFMEQFSREVQVQTSSSAHGGKRKSLSDLAFANFQAHGRPQYLSLGGDDE